MDSLDATPTIHIKIDEENKNYIKIETSETIHAQLYKNFSLLDKNYYFIKKYKSYWDGFYYFYNNKKHLLPKGFYHILYAFAKHKKYILQFDDSITNYCSIDISKDKILSFCDKLWLPITPYEHQIEGVLKALSHKNCIIQSATGSGKTLMIYCLCRYFLTKKKTTKILIIVPTTNLIIQAKNHFKEYSKYTSSFNIVDDVQTISAGKEKIIRKPITISTWQSIYKQNIKYFKQFNVIIGDEAHYFKAKNLLGIIKKCVNLDYKIGFTGTINNDSYQKYCLQGFFGNILNIVDHQTLAKKNIVTPVQINNIVIKYKKEEIEKNYFMLRSSYFNEKEFIATHKERNECILKYINNLTGVILILFELKDTHGLILFNNYTKIYNKKNSYYITGDMNGTEREEQKQNIAKETDACCFASFGVFSEGLDLPNINHIIFASSYKSKIKILQSIGRGVRKHKNKKVVIVHDFIDDFGLYENYIIKHSQERKKIYKNEGFIVKDLPNIIL